MNRRFLSAIPLSLLVGFGGYYVLLGIMAALGQAGPTDGPDLSFTLLYILSVGGAAAALMAAASATLTLLAGRAYIAWCALWPLLVYLGVVLAFCLDVQAIPGEMIVIGALALLPGLLASSATALFLRWRFRG